MRNVSRKFTQMCDFEQHIRGMYYNLLLVYFTHSIATTDPYTLFAKTYSSVRSHLCTFTYVGADLI